LYTPNKMINLKTKIISNNKNYKILALDETGKASFKHLSKNFILSGLILSEDFKLELDKKICELKKKYFNNENIVFHCRDMLRKKRIFCSFRKRFTERINR
jgi:hypothetical protein